MHKEFVIQTYLYFLRENNSKSTPLLLLLCLSFFFPWRPQLFSLLYAHLPSLSSTQIRALTPFLSPPLNSRPPPLPQPPPLPPPLPRPPPLRRCRSSPKSYYLDLDPLSQVSPASGDSSVFHVVVDLSSVPDLACSYTVAILYVQIWIPLAEKLSFLMIASTQEDAVKRGEFESLVCHQSNYEYIDIVVSDKKRADIRYIVDLDEVPSSLSTHH